jgi:hypothetical protein
MTNRIDDVDRLIDQIDQTLLNAQLARFTGAALDEQAMLALSLDAIDTAERVREVAIAEGDAAGAIASVDRQPATLLAGQFRTDLARQLRDGFDVDTEGSEALRSIGALLAQLVKSGREHRARMKANAEMDELNRNLLRRLKEETAPTLQERFDTQYLAQQGWEPSIEDRIAQRRDQAEREAIGRGVVLDEPQ